MPALISFWKGVDRQISKAGFLPHTETMNTKCPNNGDKSMYRNRVPFPAHNSRELTKTMFGFRKQKPWSNIYRRHSCQHLYSDKGVVAVSTPPSLAATSLAAFPQSTFVALRPVPPRPRTAGLIPTEKRTTVVAGTARATVARNLQ